MRLLFALMRMPLPCPLSLSDGDFRFGLDDQLRQALLAGLPVMSIDVAGPLHPVRSHWGVAVLPQVVVDLGETPCARLSPLAPVGLEFLLGRGLPGPG